MKAKDTMLVIIFIAGILIITVGYIQEANQLPSAQIPPGWTFSLSEGDALAGKTAFMKMQCSICHKANVPELDIPQGTEWIGPDLTNGYHTLTREYLAESIIKAHTIVADPNYVFKAGEPGMGQYNHHLTVKELMDLVAFLKQPTLVSQK